MAVCPVCLLTCWHNSDRQRIAGVQRTGRGEGEVIQGYVVATSSWPCSALNDDLVKEICKLGDIYKLLLCEYK